MKKFVLNSFLFVAFVTLLYFFCVILVGGLNWNIKNSNLKFPIAGYGHLKTRINQIRNDKYDVLFVGSSHAYRGFDPRIFKNHGFRSFNLGSTGQTPTITQTLLERYVRKLNPKLVIYEVYPLTLYSNGVESALDLIANDIVDHRSFELAIDLNDIRIYNALIYSSFLDLFDLKSKIQEDRRKGFDTYIDGGFVEKDLKFYDSTKNYINKPLPFSTDLGIFKSNISFLKSLNIPVILVFAPITKAYYASFEKKKEFDSEMEKIGPYINFNVENEFVDSLDFYDTNHLNKFGVLKMNQLLVDYIKTSYH